MGKRVIEITGVKGIRKSFIIQKLLNQNKNIMLDTEIINKYHLNNLNLTILFFQSEKSINNLINIIRLSLLIENITLFNRLKFIRDSIKKIGKDYFLKYKFRENRIVLVDEGVSHLYQNIISFKENNKKEINQIIDKIIFNINFSKDILIVDAPLETIIERVATKEDNRSRQYEFIQLIKDSKAQIRVLKKRFPNITKIKNIDSIDIYKTY